VDPLYGLCLMEDPCNCTQTYLTCLCAVWRIFQWTDAMQIWPACVKLQDLPSNSGQTGWIHHIWPVCVWIQGSPIEIRPDRVDPQYLTCLCAVWRIFHWIEANQHASTVIDDYWPVCVQSELRRVIHRIQAKLGGSTIFDLLVCSFKALVMKILVTSHKQSNTVDPPGMASIQWKILVSKHRQVRRMEDPSYCTRTCQIWWIHPVWPEFNGRSL
jgi:hypothetical protein